MGDAFDNSDWASYPQPPWNSIGAVAASLRLVAAATDEESGRSAYNGFLYAVGNNHAGTYYPVVVPALSHLADLLRGGRDAVRITILNILIDLVTSFEPEPGFQAMPDAVGRERDLRELVRELALGLTSDIALSASAERSPQERDLARELLDELAGDTKA